jgi:N-methylhydantoinase B/oxoprolinase/acetone carboxylase alpha subunit
VQYEIVAGGAGARAVKDGASGITVNQSNARIAPIEIIECGLTINQNATGRRRAIERGAGGSDDSNPDIEPKDV